MAVYFNIAVGYLHACKVLMAKLISEMRHSINFLISVLISLCNFSIMHFSGALILNINTLEKCLFDSYMLRGLASPLKHSTRNKSITLP